MPEKPARRSAGKKTSKKKSAKAKKPTKKVAVKKAAKKLPAKKKVTRKSPKRKTRKQKKVEHDIAKAVETIPGLIAESMRLEDEPEQSKTAKLPAPTRPPAKIAPIHRAPKNSGTLLWLGVVIISAAIFVLWIVNTRTMISDLTKNQSQEGELWNAATTDLAQVFSQVTDTDGGAIAKELDNLKDQLDQEAVAEKEASKEKIKETLITILTTTTGANPNANRRETSEN